MKKSIRSQFFRGSDKSSRSNTFQDLACEVLSFRDRQYLQDQLDVFNILQGIEGLSDDLGFSSPGSGVVSNLIRDINSGGEHFGVKANFWRLATTDVPWQLEEGTRTSLLDTDVLTNPVAVNIEEQLLSRHARYQNAVLVRDLFQCYHRADGTLSRQDELA